MHQSITKRMLSYAGLPHTYSVSSSYVHGYSPPQVDATTRTTNGRGMITNERCAYGGDSPVVVTSESNKRSRRSFLIEAGVDTAERRHFLCGGDHRGIREVDDGGSVVTPPGILEMSVGKGTPLVGRENSKSLHYHAGEGEATGSQSSATREGIEGNSLSVTDAISPSHMQDALAATSAMAASSFCEDGTLASWGVEVGLVVSYIPRCCIISSSLIWTWWCILCIADARQSGGIKSHDIRAIWKS